MDILKVIKAGTIAVVMQIGAFSLLSTIAAPLIAPMATLSWVPLAWEVITGLVLAGIVYGVSRWYFATTPGSIRKGLYLGFGMMVTSVLVAGLQTLTNLAQLLTMLFTVSFAITTAITLTASTLAGYTSCIRPNCHVKDAMAASMPSEAQPQ